MPAKRAEKTPMPQREALQRARDFGEVNQGYTRARAAFEAERCLRCQEPV
jgi:glutamate synthase (NADPH/NADH) small chain